MRFTEEENALLKIPVKKNKRLSVIERLRIVIDRKNGLKIQDIADKYSITPKTVHNVINRFNEELARKNTHI